MQSQSSGFHVLWSFFDLLIFKTSENMVPSKRNPADLDSPRQIVYSWICFSCGRTQIINLPAIWGTSEGSETSELEYSTRQIQFCPDYFCLGIILKVIQYNFKIIPTAGLDVQYELTKKIFANKPEGLRHFRDHRWKALGEENPDLSGLFLFRHYFWKLYWVTFKIMPKQK